MNTQRYRSQSRTGGEQSRGMPSMTALLGLLAIAGYQNRDKLAEMLKGAGSDNAKLGGGAQQPGVGGLLGNLSGMLGGAGVGGLLNGGIGELLERFKQNGQGETAESWINDGPNKGGLAPTIETGDRVRCFGHAGAADRPFSGRASCPAFARASDGS